MKKSEAIFGILRIPADGLAVAAGILLSYHLRSQNIDLIPSVQLLEPATTLPEPHVFLTTFVVPAMLCYVFIASLYGLYAIRITRSAWREVGSVILVSILWLVSIMSWFFLVQKQLFYSRALLVHATFFNTLFVLMLRTAFILFQRGLMRHGIGVRQVVSIGSEPIARAARETLVHDVRYEYLGHYPDLSSLKQLEHSCPLDLILQTDPNPKSTNTVELIDYCRSHHIEYGYQPPVLSDVPHQLEVERLGLLPLIRFRPTPLDGWGRVWKRLFDFVCSIVFIVLLAPLMLLIGVAILLTEGRPIFYISPRVGERADKSIPVIKFRSMVKDADRKKIKLLGENERRDGPLFKMKNDPRITPIGHLIRRFDLDELPQLFNVVAGHMSLVGPRPHLQEEVDRYRPYERRVFAVKPGITGLAQVSGRSQLTFKEEVRYDLQYIEEWSLFSDLWILWRTLAVVLFRNES